MAGKKAGGKGGETQARDQPAPMAAKSRGDEAPKAQPASGGGKTRSPTKSK